MIALLKNKSGATSIEYALIGSLIFLVIITAVGLVGQDLLAIFQAVAAGF